MGSVGRHVILQHSLGDEDLVKVFVVSPDSLISWLRAPGLAAASPLSHDVDDSTWRIERLVES